MHYVNLLTAHACCMKAAGMSRINTVYQAVERLLHIIKIMLIFAGYDRHF